MNGFLRRAKPVASAQTRTVSICASLLKMCCRKFSTKIIKSRTGKAYRNSMRPCS